MPIRYAENIDSWETWQKEYRFGVILVFPPEPLFSVVNELRALHDPRSQAYCDAHISLTVPAPTSISKAEWQELEAAASDYEPLRLRYGPLKTYPQHPGVTLAIEPQDRLDEIRRTLEQLPPFRSAPPRPWPFSAHMTIAEFIPPERTHGLIAELASMELRGDFLCSHLSYAVPDGFFHFTERRQLPLGRRAAEQALGADGRARS